MSHFNYEICERFAPIFLRRTHVALASRLNRFRIGFYRKRVNRRFITTFKGTQFHENLLIYEF
ncbi:hypothetical protein FF021_19085 [Leptospira noguchii]|nr:hypothetical protein FF021_19085 [Leptospira noguchii]